MTLTATKTSAGFEPVFNLALGHIPNPIKFELTPNTAFSKGDAVVLTDGKVAKAAANAANVLGVMAEAFTTSTNPSAERTMGMVYCHADNVYRCTFSDHRDATATGGTTTTLVDTAISQSTNDYWNGAMVYIYEGANGGTLLTVKDYTGSSDTLTFEEVLPEACDTTTKYIMLGYGTGATGDVINIGSFGVDLKDENTIDADATIAAEAGPLVVMPTPKDEIKNLMLRVMFRKHLFRPAA